MYEDSDRKISAFRKLFFWLFSFFFLFCTPIVIFYSLGYKFDRESKKFLKTGTISIKTFPRGARVYLNGRESKEITPCFLKELFPRAYTFSLQKENFYPYQMELKVKPGLVSEIDVVLVPEMNNMEKIKIDFDVYKFFVSTHLLGIKIVALTDKGIYFLDKDFSDPRRITAQTLDKDTANTIEGLKEDSNKLVFWNKSNIWMVRVNAAADKSEEGQLEHVYKAEETVNNVFWGLKERYLIIQDGLKLIALDRGNSAVFFPIFELKSVHSTVFYDARSEMLYIKDKISETGTFSLFKTKLIPFVHEKKEN